MKNKIDIHHKRRINNLHIVNEKGLVVHALQHRMHSVHVVTESPVVEHLSAWRAMILPRRHVLLGHVPFRGIFPLDCRQAQETDEAGIARLQLLFHQSLQFIQFLLVRRQI
jgi:hypothetical protein